MTKRILFIFTGISLFFLFVVFSYIVHTNIFTSLDFDTTVRLQNHISRRFDSIFSLLSLMGSFESITILIVVLLVIYRKWRGIIPLVLYLSTHLFELYGKFFVTHPSPPFMFLRYNIGFSFPSTYVQPGSSYPSGHSARTAFFAVLFIFILFHWKKLPKTNKLLLSFFACLFALAMFISRIYLGEHWLSDVIGGSLLGTGFGFIGIVFL